MKTTTGSSKSLNSLGRAQNFSPKKTPARKILVTGGLGFVGFHLCQSLLQEFPDSELTIVDNLCSTKLDYQPLVDLADIHITDLRDYNAGSRQFDDVYHLASPVGSLGILHRHGQIASDILELAQVANNIAANSGAQLLYLSSSEVYGRDGQHDETADQVVPARYGTRMEYALGKLTAEHVLINLADKSNHNVRIVRPFNVVGNWQSDALGFVMPAFFKAALLGQPLFVHGSGEQTRSFCHVNDLVEGVLAVQLRGQSGSVYNIGNPNNRTTITGLAKAIIHVCESRSAIELIDPQQHYGPHYLEAYNKMPAIDRADEHTGWRPTIALEDILQDLLKFYANGICFHNKAWRQTRQNRTDCSGLTEPNHECTHRQSSL